MSASRCDPTTSLTWKAVRPRAVVIAIISVLSGFCMSSGYAASASGQDVESAFSSRPAVTSRNDLPATGLRSADLEAFFDGMIPLEMSKGDIAGGAIVVVKGDRVLFQKAYGYANVAKKRKFSVATLVRPGSISKLFTWTAIMQLVERKRIRLDDDINDYLDTKVGAECGRITIRNLMTHTAGFQEAIKNIYFYAPTRPSSIGEYLRHNPAPHCIFRPGTVIAYSNYGATLAGHIVERVSGMPFETYIKRFIFEPLEMRHSTFQQPLPDYARNLASSGYSNTQEPERPEEVIQVSPAGGLWSSPEDIAKFVIAQLNGGERGGKHILQPETVRLMQSHQLSAAPGFNGFALGFYEMSRNGHRVVSHAGDTRYFHSDMYLLPSEHVGIFVTFNSSGNDDASEALNKAIYRAFMDRYFPAGETKSAPTLPAMKRDAQRVSGSYIVSRRNEVTFLRLTNIFRPGTEFAISTAPDGTLTTGQFVGLDGHAEHWREIGPLLYQSTTNSDRMKFVLDASGQIVLMTTDADIPVYVSQPVPWLEDARFILPLLQLMLGIFLLMGAVRPLIFISPLQKWFNLGIFSIKDAVIALWCLLNLGLTYAWYSLIVAPRLSPSFSDSLDPWLITLYSLGWLSVAGAIFTTYATWRILRSPHSLLLSRIGAIVASIAGAFFVVFLVVFHLLNFALSY